MKEPPFKIGDKVRPRPAWAAYPGLVPAGKVIRVEQYGTHGALVIEGNARAYSADVFEIDEDEVAK